MKDIAVLTGASRGIGWEIFSKLLESHHKINPLIISRGDIKGIEHYSCDVSDYKGVETVFHIINRDIGTPTLLINCAGYVEPKSILEMTSEEWDYTLRVNLSGVFYCTQQFVKYLKNLGQQQGKLIPGKIINIASTAGTRPSPGWSAYAAAKAGLINFSLTMSEELRPYGIKVYCVAPGRCATDLRRKLAPDEDQSRIMQPEEVADFVYYLATQDKGTLDGQVLTVARKGTY